MVFKRRELKIGKQQRYRIEALERRMVDQARELADIDIGHTAKILEGAYENLCINRKDYTKGVDVAIDFSILRPNLSKLR